MNFFFWFLISTHPPDSLIVTYCYGPFFFSGPPENPQIVHKLMSRCHAFNASLLLLVLSAIVALYQYISNLVRSRQVNPPSIDRHLFSSLQVSAFPKSYLNCKLIRSSTAYFNNLSSSLSVSRTKYVSLVACNCFPITSDLMILSHTLHLSPDGIPEVDQL